MQRRRSQLAANSSAPPTQTPSTAAIAGTGAASTTRVRRWKRLDRRRPGGRVGLERRLQVVAGGEVLAGAAQHDAADAPGRRRRPRSRRRSRSSSSRSQALRRAWRSQVTIRAAPLSVGGDGHRAVSLLRLSTAARQRVAARGPVDDAGLVLGHGQRAGLEPRDREARAQRCRAAARASAVELDAPAAPRRTPRSGGAIGSPSATTQWRPSRASARPGSRRSPAGRRSRPARAACRRGGRRSGCAAWSRPQAQGEVQTRPRSPER